MNSPTFDPSDPFGAKAEAEKTIALLNQVHLDLVRCRKELADCQADRFTLEVQHSNLKSALGFNMFQETIDRLTGQIAALKAENKALRQLLRSLGVDDDSTLPG